MDATNVWPQMALTVIKVFFKKLKTKTITYWSYKPFSNVAFVVEIQNRIYNISKAALDETI